MRKIIYICFAILLVTGVFTTKSYSQDTSRVLIEVSTGTWCQYCPCGHVIVNTIMTNRPQTLALEYHGPVGQDPWASFNGNAILTTLGIGSAFPTGVVGRRSGVIDRGSWAGQVYTQPTNFPAGMKLWYSKTYNPATRELSVTAYATALRNIDTATNINFVLYENNLIYTQSGNAGCIGGSSYVHKYVVRDMVNGAAGESLSTGSWVSGTVKTKTWTYILPAAWVADNIGFGVFVYQNIGTLNFDSHVMNTNKGTAIDPVSGVGNQNERVGSYTLSQNYPNPFNPTTNIRFSIPKNSQTSLKIYDVIGNEVNTYFEEFLNAGTYSVQFDGGNLSSGIYYYKLTSGDFTETKRMMLVK
ncbi:MAG: Omp28-related outer membrane protein [Ignavibacteriae bacterium]|nr:Omp28-related outer membrane protein [Ignavibacteriota bacterium]